MRFITEHCKQKEETITCEIVEPTAVLSENEKGYTKENNLVSWNGAEPKFDITNRRPGRERFGKGIVLTNDESINLMDAMEHDAGRKIVEAEKRKKEFLNSALIGHCSKSCPGHG